MYRLRPTQLARVVPAAPRLAHAARAVRAAPRRLASTSSTPASSASSKRSWKGAAVRWGAAGAALYWYNTSPVFADDAALSPLAEVSSAANSSSVPEEQFSTIDLVLEEKQKEARRRAEAKQAEEAATKEATETESAAADSPEALEAEAGQQGAFNPETGEINWDCPCLGGMAHGPCGEDFKAAFSCFVFSTEEPKGMDCIDKFQHMQDCFRKYPEIYGAELQDDDEAGDVTDVTEDAPANGAPTRAQIAEKLAETEVETEKPKAEAEKAEAEKAEAEKPKSEDKPDKSEKQKAKKTKAKAKKTTAQTGSFPAAATDATASNADPPAEDADGALPKAAFDATGANK